MSVPTLRSCSFCAALESFQLHHTCLQPTLSSSFPSPSSSPSSPNYTLAGLSSSSAGDKYEPWWYPVRLRGRLDRSIFHHILGNPSLCSTTPSLFIRHRLLYSAAEMPQTHISADGPCIKNIKVTPIVWSASAKGCNHGGWSMVAQLNLLCPEKCIKAK